MGLGGVSANEVFAKMSDKLTFIELSMGRHIGSVVVEFTINILL